MLRVFVEFDSDGNGELDIGEFRAALNIMGVTLPPDRMRKLFKYFDQDNNNMVGRHEITLTHPCHPVPPLATPHPPLTHPSPTPRPPLTNPSLALD